METRQPLNDYPNIKIFAIVSAAQNIDDYSRCFCETWIMIPQDVQLTLLSSWSADGEILDPLFAILAYPFYIDNKLDQCAYGLFRGYIDNKLDQCAYGLFRGRNAICLNHNNLQNKSDRIIRYTIAHELAHSFHFASIGNEAYSSLTATDREAAVPSILKSWHIPNEQISEY